MPACEVRTVLFEAPSGGSAEITLPEPLRIYSRRVFDRALARRAERAGAVLRAEKVLSVAVPDDRAGSSGETGVSVRTASTEERFDALVGADGVRSLVRHTLARPFGARDLTQAVGVYVPGTTEDVARLSFEEGLDGYLWSFPRTDHLAVGACAPLRPGTADLLRVRLDRYLRRIVPGVASSTLRSYSALIPTLSPAAFRANVLCGPGWCLVGDAAAAVDPLTREGIAWGLRSSVVASEALLAGRPAAYPAEWERRYGAELRWAAERRDRFYAPELTERLVRTLTLSRAVRAVMADLLLGRQPYLTLKRRLVACALPAAFRWFFLRFAA